MCLLWWKKPSHLPRSICLLTFISSAPTVALTGSFNQAPRCLTVIGVSYAGPVISSGDAQKEADGFNLKREGKNFLVVLLLPPPAQHSPRFDWKMPQQRREKKSRLMTNVRRVSTISLQILTRLPSGSRLLTPTPTPPLRRENRILWLA